MGAAVKLQPQRMPEPCTEHQRLAERFADASQGYSDAVAKLASHRSITTELEYRELRVQVDEARQDTGTALLALERHISRHGC